MDMADIVEVRKGFSTDTFNQVNSLNIHLLTLKYIHIKTYYGIFGFISSWTVMQKWTQILSQSCKNWTRILPESVI